MKNLKLVILLYMLSVLSIRAQMDTPEINSMNTTQLKNNKYKDLKLVTASKQDTVYETAISDEAATKVPKVTTVFENETGHVSNRLSVSLGFRAAFFDGVPHFLRGDYFQTWISGYEINEGRKIKRKRTRFSGDLIGTPEYVTAAVKHPHSEKVYLFKGNKYYRLKLYDNSLEKTGTINVDGWKGVPANITAAVNRKEQNSTYFFKGSKYYRYSYTKKRVDITGTIGVDGWKGVPTSPDLAFMHTNDKIYFFKDEFYYRYNLDTKKVDKKELIKKGWKGLITGIDAAVYNTTHDDVHFFNGRYAKYFPLPSGITLVGESNRVETNGMLRKEMKTNTLGDKWYTGAPQNLDAATPLVLGRGVSTEHTKYMFFKGKKVYFWYHGNKTKLKSYNIKKEISNKIPYNIDAAVTAKMDRATSTSLLYFFKYDTYYVVEFRAGNFTSKGYGKIKNKFPYAPDNIDAARLGPDGFIFYKGLSYYTPREVGLLSGKLAKKNDLKFQNFF